MKDKLREEIVEEISSMIDIAKTADRILSLIAPELDAARKWDRVKEIAARNWLDGYPCGGCSVEDMCDSSLSLCGQADSIVDALEKEPT